MSTHATFYRHCQRLLCACWLATVVCPTAALAQVSTTPFIGEIRWVAFNFPPRGWAACNGQLLAINQNQALFALLGTTYGGNGITSFALPDLRGRAPIHVSVGHPLGSMGGEEAHMLIVSEMPAHNHAVLADAKEANAAVAANNYLAKTSNGTPAYGLTAGANTLGMAIASAGSNTPHPNMKPYIALNCIIALQGIFPSRL